MCFKLPTDRWREYSTYRQFVPTQQKLFKHIWGKNGYDSKKFKEIFYVASNIFFLSQESNPGLDLFQLWMWADSSNVLVKEDGRKKANNIKETWNMNMKKMVSSLRAHLSSLFENFIWLTLWLTGHWPHILTYWRPVQDDDKNHFLINM